MTDESHHLSSDHTDPSDLDLSLDSDIEHEGHKVKVRPGHSSTDQTVPVAVDSMPTSPSKQSMTDSEDGSSKQDIRESCEREDELVSEKSRSQQQGQGDQGRVTMQPGACNVDVGGAAQSVGRGELEGSSVYCSSGYSASNTNPASPL